MSPMANADGTDATLLHIIGTMRGAADHIAGMLSDHMRDHPDHPLTGCKEGLARIAMILGPLGASLAVNGYTMLEQIQASAIADMMQTYPDGDGTGMLCICGHAAALHYEQRWCGVRDCHCDCLDTERK